MRERKIGANRGNAGKGRPKGSPNKITAALKDAILQAAENVHPDGLVGYLQRQAMENPTAFMVLLGKTLPMQTDMSLAGGLQVDATLTVVHASRPHPSGC